MAHGTYQDPVKRAHSPAPEMRVADLVFVDAPYPGLPKVFTCSTLSASINQKQCSENYGRLNSCESCAVGKHHQSIEAPKPLRRAEFGDGQYSNRRAMPCVRCGADGTAARLVGRMRLVHQVNRWLPDSVDALSVDVSCHNREKEVISGRNSKGAKPVRHASLREAVATYSVGKKLYSDIAIGMRSGIPEIRRLLARGYPNSPVELISATMGGIDISVDSLIDPLFRSTYVKPSKKAAAPSTTLAAVLADLEDSVPSREPHDAPNTKRARKPREPRIEALHDFGFPRDIDDLAAWLLDEITPRPSRAVEPVAPVVDTFEPIKTTEPAKVDSEWSGVTVRDGRGVKYDVADMAARLEVAPEKIALAFGIQKAPEAVKPSVDDISPAWRAIFGDPAEAPKREPRKQRQRPLPPLSAKDVAAYRQPFSADERKVVDPVAPVALGNTYGGMSADQFAARFMHSQREDQPKGCDDILTLATGCSLTGEYVPAQAAVGIDATTTSEKVIEPVAAAPVKPQKTLTGKQLRKLEKAERRAERQKQQFPNTRATQAAIGSRSLALVAIYQSQSARKA